MLAPSDLLRFLYNAVEDEIRTDVQPQAHLHTAIGNEDDDDDDDDDAQDLEDQKAFLDWEIKLVSRSTGTHDFEARDPAINRDGQEKVSAHLDFLDSQLKQRKQTLPLNHKDERVETPPSGGDFQEARSYVNDTVKNGAPDKRLRSALHPKTLADLKGWVGRFTNLHTFFEQHQQHEDTAATASANLTQAAAESNSIYTELDDHEMLYQHLTDIADCNVVQDHYALLQLPTSSDGSVHLFLLACQRDAEQLSIVHWHETTVILTAPNPNKGLLQRLSICDEVLLYQRHRRRLCLSCDELGIRHKSEPSQARPGLLQRPQPVSLSQVLEQRQDLRQEDLEIRFKKSRLALELASSLIQLYPGPWVQEIWDVDSVRVLASPSNARVLDDLKPIGVKCKLSTDWRNNQVFRDSQNSTSRNCPAFFLSFAQLLVDIFEGERTLPDEQDWFETLMDKAEEMIRSELHQWYGEAIRGCLHYALDYHVDQKPTENPRNKARAVIRKNIIDNLRMNLQFWEAEWKNHYTLIPAPKPTKSHSQDLQISKPPLARQSFFTLFAEGDERYEERKQNDKTQNEFMSLMESFKQGFILPVATTPHQSTIFKPILIAVIDTGLHVDEQDNLLRRASGKRLRKDLSRSFLSENNHEDYNDTHGHGTHVTRLLLGLTLRAEVMMVKISDGPSLESTKLKQIVDALEWADEAGADIINLSFGLDEAAKGMIQPVIDRLFNKGKLIFAAASNSGGNGKRAYPAKEMGVFAIHATKEQGTTPEDLNPPRVEAGDNFATLGHRIPSRWKGKDVFITGTSFAAPIAAAIAANALEFARRAPPEFQSDDPRYFFRYSGMRRLFTHLASRMGDYDYIRPWKDDMFDKEQDIETMQWKLQKMSMIHKDDQYKEELLKGRIQSLPVDSE